MELRDYIDAAIKVCGTAVELAKHLDQNPTAIRNAKCHQRGLPVFACIQLAQLLEVDPMEVIAASELVTEKNERRKAVFFPFVQMAGFARPWMIAWLALISACLLAIGNSLLIGRDFLL